MQGRECTQCKEFKTWDKFSLEKLGRNGRAAKCKDCKNVNRRKYDYNKYQRTRFKHKECGVYLITTDEGLYVGESSNLVHRLSQHTSLSRYSPCFGKKVLKKEILEYVKDPKVRLERESYWIKKLNPALNSQKV